MKPFVANIAQAALRIRNRVEIIFEKFFDHQDRPVADLVGPVVEMFQQGLNDLLSTKNMFEIAVRFRKKSFQPLLAADCSCEIQFVKNRKFFFGVKDGNIAECGFVNLHNEQNADYYDCYDWRRSS